MQFRIVAVHMVYIGRIHYLTRSRVACEDGKRPCARRQQLGSLTICHRPLVVQLSTFNVVWTGQNQCEDTRQSIYTPPKGLHILTIRPTV